MIDQVISRFLEDNNPAVNLSKSYLPKERIGKPSKWVSFYVLLAEKERTSQCGQFLLKQ
jgi:hypothetical protein